MSDAEQLLEQGRLAEAAELLESTGDPLRATGIYEQLWDFAAATRAARAAGDLPRALANCLREQNRAQLESLMGEILEGSNDLLRRCAEVCRERGALAEAARLLRRASDVSAAAELFEQAGMLLEAARLQEGQAELSRAIDLYRRHLAEAPETPVAQFALGRLLLRHGRPAEALPLLQATALGHGPDARLAGVGVVVALARLGYRSGAREALRLLPAGDLATQYEEVHDCLTDPEFATAETSESSVLAGRYRLERLLGSGAMGRVYLAHDLLEGHAVAIKIFASPGGGSGRDAYRRFVREARATGRLQHPHIVSLLDFDEELGFIVLEPMAGGTLVERIGPALDLGTCRSVLLQLLDGLGAAHQRGIVHRDIKPSNIFFTAAGAAKLGDFGVAHLQDSGQTQTGAFIGTVAYMAPEQIIGAPVTFATDIYALGVTLFLMLTGELPFSPPELVDKHLHAAPPAPSSIRPELPRAYDQLLARCLAKKPEARFESLAAMARAVEGLPVPEARTPPPAGQTADRDGSGAMPQAPPGGRYSAEATACDSDALRVIEGRDDHLGREVTLVQVLPGPRRAPLLALLAAAARAGPHLQRVLCLDGETGAAVLQRLPERRLDGRGVADALGAGTAARAAQLAAALEPLHDAGVWHGKISAEVVAVQGQQLTLGLVQALLSWSAPTDDSAPPGSVADDVTAVLRLCAIDRAPALADARALGRWAEDREAAAQAQAARDRRDALIARALEQAPAEIRGALGAVHGDADD